MGVVYYQYKSEKEAFSVPVPHSFVPVCELKHLILTSNRHGHGRTRGRGPREDITISNAQTGEEYADESAFIPQNTTVLIRRITGQLSEKIVMISSRKVIEDGSIPSNMSVVIESASKSCSSTEEQDEDAAIASVIDAAQLKWEEQSHNRSQTSGMFTSRRNYGRLLEGETPPPGYVCRNCGVPGHFIQHCPQEIKAPPPGYVCYRCRIPGHFIHLCPTIGDPKFDNYRKCHSLAPVVSEGPIDGIPSSLTPAASVSVAVDLPAELYCRLCNKVMTNAMLTSKCCFDSFCDKCIRDYIVTESKCICGVKVLADDLIPNHTLRSTISNMLATKVSSTTSGTGKHNSSSVSNPDSKSQSAPLTALERDVKQLMDRKLASDTQDHVLQVGTKDDPVSLPQEKLAMDVDLNSKDTGNSAGSTVENAVPSVDVLKLKAGSESTSKNTTISGTLGPKAARTEQSKKKLKKSDSTKIGHPNVTDYGYSIPVDPAYYTPFHSGYPWLAEPCMYGSLGMPYGGYPMGPYVVNSINMPLQALAMQGYPANLHSRETHSSLHPDTEAAAYPRQVERPAHPRQAEGPKGTGLQSRPSGRNQQHLGSSPGIESRDNSRSRLPDRREDHGRSGRTSNRMGSPQGTKSNPRPEKRRDHGRSGRASNHLGTHGRTSNRMGSPQGTKSNPRPEKRRDHGRSDRASNDYEDDHHSRKRMRAPSPMDDKQSRHRSRHSSRSLTRDDSSDEECYFKRRWGRRSSVTSDTRF